MGALLAVFVGGAPDWDLSRQQPEKWTARPTLADWTSEVWDEVFVTNLKARFFLAQQPRRRCVAKGTSELYITSIVGILGRSTVHAYAASKRSDSLASLALSPPNLVSTV